jgi:hypothetical protein
MSGDVSISFGMLSLASEASIDERKGAHQLSISQKGDPNFRSTFDRTVRKEISTLSLANRTVPPQNWPLSETFADKLSLPQPSLKSA